MKDDLGIWSEIYTKSLTVVDDLVDSTIEISETALNEKMRSVFLCRKQRINRIIRKFKKYGKIRKNSL